MPQLHLYVPEDLATEIARRDLMIAATARAHDAVLVSHNVQEFARVVGLRIEDWEAEA